MAKRLRKTEIWRLHEFLIATGVTIGPGQPVCLETTAGATQGLLVPWSVATTLVPIGYSAESADIVGDGTKKATVDLVTERVIEWRPNSAAPNAVAATDVGGVCYGTATAAVTITATGASIAGRVWGVRGSGATAEVAVEMLKESVLGTQTGNIAANKVTAGTAYQVLRTNAAGTASEWGTPIMPAPASDLPAFVANDSVLLAADCVSGRTYSVPATGAASTVTLPAGAADGTVIHIVADGTNNDETVQYRDATGPANLTTALTASKRHHVVATKMGGKWFAAAYVSP